MKGENLSLVLRHAQEADLPFLYSSFVKSMSRQPFFSRAPKDYMTNAHHSIAGKIFANTNIIVATHPEVDETYGYICFLPEARELFYIYTKYAYRKEGVATLLMLSAFGDFAAPIKNAIATVQSKYHIERWNLEYTPEILTKLVLG